MLAKIYLIYQRYRHRSENMNPSTAKKPSGKKATQEADEELIPASFGLPPDVHAKVVAEAEKEERTLAAQLRVIVKKWAESQPSAT